MSFIEKDQVLNNIKYSKWRPDYFKNNEILNNNNIVTNADYRRFLTNNASNIINLNKATEEERCCQPIRVASNKGSNVPYLYQEECVVNGEQFAYPENDLKRNYMFDFHNKSTKRAIEL